MSKFEFVALARRFVRDDRGAVAIEYGILAALIAGAIILAVTNVGTAVSNVFGNIANNVSL